MESTQNSFMMEESVDYFTSEYPQQNISQLLNSSFTHHPQCGAGPNNLGRYISMILFTVVCIIGLFGNTLVIYVVLR